MLPKDLVVYPFAQGVQVVPIFDENIPTGQGSHRYGESSNVRVKILVLRTVLWPLGQSKQDSIPMDALCDEKP